MLVGASTIEEALPQLTQQVCAALGWEIGGAWLVHNSDLQLRAVWSPQAALDEALNAALSDGLSYKRGERLAGEAWNTRELVWLHDAQQDERFAHVRHLGIRSGSPSRS